MPGSTVVAKNAESARTTISPDAPHDSAVVIASAIMLAAAGAEIDRGGPARAIISADPVVARTEINALIAA
jgi:hypothetical protein